MIYRHKFTNELTDELISFSKKYRYTPRKDIKDIWKSFLREPKMINLINMETERLKHDKYDGDIIKKMYISVKYYYMKQSSITIIKPLDKSNNINKEKRMYNINDYKITEEIKNKMNEFLSHDNIQKKQTVLWNEFIEKNADYKDNKYIKKALANKIYTMKQKIKTTK